MPTRKTKNSSSRHSKAEGNKQTNKNTPPPNQKVGLFSNKDNDKETKNTTPQTIGKYNVKLYY